MSGTRPKTRIASRIEPYWYVIVILIVGGAFVLINHLLTGQTPNRVAIHIAVFDFDIFWYGIFIVGGIALGTLVTSRLAAERAELTMKEYVPSKIRRRPLSSLELPDEISQSFEKRSMTTLGQLLLEWGLSPDRLALSKSGKEEVLSALEKEPDVEQSWLDAAPWRQWNPAAAHNPRT